MEINEWGPCAWKFMHASTFAQKRKIPLDRQAQLKAFFENVGNALPCTECCKHYNEFVKKNPPPVDSRDALSRWLVKVHNNVNKITNNPFSRHMSFEEVRRIYAYEESDEDELDELGVEEVLANECLTHKKRFYVTVLGGACLVILALIVVIIVAWRRLLL